jgi:thiamine kinase-like enzyme
MRIDDVVERLWPGQEAVAEPLGGGITNHNFKVSVGGKELVLRVGGKDTELLGIDRGHEHEAALVAAEFGIGPEVVWFEEGCLVTRYVEGRVGGPDATDAAPLLRRLHSGPAISSTFDAFRVVEVYAATAQERGVALPRVYDETLGTARRIEEARRGARAVTCHNDLLAANFIHDGTRLWIVDWEYAGMGDPYFDLANFAVNNELDDDGEQALLRAYGAGDARALTLMRFMSDFREAMWGVVQQAISELDFDFVAYADEHFERLERTAREPRFREALAA